MPDPAEYPWLNRAQLAAEVRDEMVEALMRVRQRWEERWGAEARHPSRALEDAAGLPSLTKLAQDEMAGLEAETPLSPLAMAHEYALVLDLLRTWRRTEVRLAEWLEGVAW